MKKFAFALLAMATALAITPRASASPITGSIAIDGSADTWTLTTIKFTTTAGNATVQGAPATSGSLLAVVGDDVTFPTNPLTFSTATGDELFSTGDGVTFTITGLTVDYDVVSGLAAGLILNGTGTLTENGYTITDATWTLNSSKTGGTTFGIDAAPLSATPEPSSLVLLGSGLFGLAFVAFRKAKTSGLVLHS